MRVSLIVDRIDARKRHIHGYREKSHQLQVVEGSYPLNRDTSKEVYEHPPYGRGEQTEELDDSRS